MTSAPAKRQRIITLDIMRGYFLVMIIINHLYFFPSIYELITGRGELWVSAAEGFFLISGMLVGYIYTRKMSENARAATFKMFRRAGLLYFWAIALTTLALLWVHIDPGHTTKEGIWWQPPILEYLYKVLTLQYNYGWSDFLQYYVLFMLFAPLAVWLCINRKAWLVLLLSVIVWFFRGTNFNMAWQLLFMSGIVIGYYLPRIEAWYNARSKASRTKIGWAVGVPTVITVLASIAVMHGPMLIAAATGGHASDWLINLRTQLESWQATSGPRTDKWSLAPARLVLIALWFTALYLLVRTHEKLADKITLGVFRRIGEVSLLVYGIHALVILGIHMYLPAGGFGDNLPGAIYNTLFTTGLLALFYFVVRYRSLFKTAVGKAWRLVYTR